MPQSKRDALSDEHFDKQRAEEDRVFAEEERLRVIAPSCQPALAQWRAERAGTWRKLQLYDRLSADCRKLADAELARARKPLPTHE